MPICVTDKSVVQEVLDLSDLDFPLDDDAASIRDVRTAALTAASSARLSQQQQPPLSGSSRRPSPISPGNVGGWTHNEVAAVSSNWGSSFGSSVAGGSGSGLGGLGLGSGSTGGFYGSAKKTK